MAISIFLNFVDNVITTEGLTFNGDDNANDNSEIFNNPPNTIIDFSTFLPVLSSQGFTNNADSILGNGGDDTLNGGDGNDTIDGGRGFYDRIFGGAGDDIITDLDGVNAANGGSGNDTITVTFSGAWVKPPDPRSDGKIQGGDGDDTITVTMGNNDFFLKLFGDTEPTESRAGGNDTITLQGNYHVSQTFMGVGDDIFNGGSGNDEVRGDFDDLFTGDDSLGGNDELNGGDGNDALMGDFGDDTLVGGNGIDKLTGGLGSDSLTGGAGNDLFIYQAVDIADAATETDIITDFVQGSDFIALGTGLTLGDNITFSVNSVLYLGNTISTTNVILTADDFTTI